MRKRARGWSVTTRRERKGMRTGASTTPPNSDSGSNPPKAGYWGPSRGHLAAERVITNLLGGSPAPLQYTECVIATPTRFALLLLASAALLLKRRLKRP